MILEKDVEKYLKKEVKKLGGKALKFTSTEKGVPDQVLLMPNGNTVFVEVKKPDGQLRKNQIKMHQTFKQLNQEVYTVSSKHEVLLLMNKISGY